MCLLQSYRFCIVDRCSTLCKQKFCYQSNKNRDALEESMGAISFCALNNGRLPPLGPAWSDSYQYSR